MFDVDNGLLPVDFDGDGILDSFGSTQDAPSERFARKITDVAVNKVPDPASRERIKYFVAPKMVATVHFAGQEQTHTTKPSLDANAWLRFATAHSKPHRVRVVGDHRGGGKTAFVPLALPLVGRNFTQLSPQVLEQEPVEVNVHSEAADSPFVVEDARMERAFIPSKNLIEAWLDGLNAVRAEGGHAALPPVSKNTEAQYSEELVRQLRKVISNFAKRKAYDGGRYRITFGGRFLPSIEGLIEDHLMLPPRNAVQFLDAFKVELYAQSSDGPVFRGRWGELIVDEASELVLVLQKRRARRLSAFLKER
ncbi:MAG: hypothetical protein QNI90_18735 [Dinoroseobacter sp.]|nr:hypothetical protein [Dinoroseobacter sp.]